VDSSSKAADTEEKSIHQRFSYRIFIEIMPTNTQSKPVVKSISYQTNEDKVLMMEDWLMGHYGYNRSQLHKQLIRKEYQTQRMV